MTYLPAIRAARVYFRRNSLSSSTISGGPEEEDEDEDEEEEEEKPRNRDDYLRWTPSRGAGSN